MRSATNWQEAADTLHALQRRMSSVQKAENDGWVRAAMAYVWGLQDATDAIDHDEPLEFGYAYGVHAALFELGEHYVRRNLKDAFSVWGRGEVIR